MCEFCGFIQQGAQEKPVSELRLGETRLELYARI